VPVSGLLFFFISVPPSVACFLAITSTERYAYSSSSTTFGYSPKRNWCLLFDKTLSDRISIVWPHNWQTLSVNLPPWGLVKGDDANKLIDFSIANEIEAREFLQRHDVW